MATSNRLTIHPTSSNPIEVIFQEVTSAQTVANLRLVSRVFSKSAPTKTSSLSEDRLVQIPLFRADNITRHWCLCNTDDPQQLLASCRTTRREMFVRDDETGVVRKAHYYVIAAVATDAQFRGQGLAAFLMRKVAGWADAPSGGDAELTVLYSAVGDYYVKFGWELQDCKQLVLRIPEEFSIDDERIETLEIPSNLTTRLLRREDIPDLCTKDIARLGEQAKTKKLPLHQRLAIPLPTGEVISWFGETANWLSQNFARGPPVTHIGAICEEADAWVFWYHHFIAQKLYITRFAIGDNDHVLNVRAVIKLLTCALQELIHSHGALREIVIWDPSSEVLAAGEVLKQRLGVEVNLEERKGVNHTSLRWRDGAKKASFWPNQFYAYD